MSSMPPVNGAAAPGSKSGYSTMMNRTRKTVKSITNLKTIRNSSPVSLSRYGGDGLMQTHAGSTSFFNFNTPIFTVKTDGLDRTPTKISTDSLHRLGIRAKHKVDRIKYDSTNEICKQ